MSKRSAVVVVLGLLLASCTSVTGSGTIVSETRDVPAFDGVDAASGINVRIVVDPAASHSVTVNYDDNVLEFVDTDVSGSTLEVKFDGDVSLSGGAERYVEVITPTLARVEASSGANILARGSVDRLDVDASSGANLAIASLEAVDVTLDASSGANVQLSASGSVSGDASSGANVTVSGWPSAVDVDTSGGANVSYLE